MLFLRDFGPTEVGGFGISSAEDLLLVEDIELVRQTCSAVHVVFHDESVADYFDRQVDAGYTPAQCGRIWLHTHPGHCPRPSSTDEDTFARVFGKTDWALMFILARDGATYARIRANTGPGVQQELSVEVDYRAPFAASSESDWEKEYLANVHDATLNTKASTVKNRDSSRSDPFDEWDESEFCDPLLQTQLRGY